MAAFTTIAAGVGLATSLAGSGASFAQAAKQKKEQRRAESAADRAMKEAKAEMRKNYLDQLAIAKEPYEFQREMMAQQTAQALAGLQEGDPRGLAAGVGRVAGVGTQAAQQMRAGMSKEIQELEQMKAQEDVNLSRSRADLALEEAKGAGAAAAQAANLRAQAAQQGVQGIVDAGTQAMQFAALYGKTPQTKTKGPSGPTGENVMGITATEAAMDPLGQGATGATQVIPQQPPTYTMAPQSGLGAQTKTSYLDVPYGVQFLQPEPFFAPMALPG